MRPKSDRTIRSRAGFTLLEVMVALAIVGIGLGVVIRSITLSVRSGELTERYSTAVLLAESKVSEALLGPLAIGKSEGDCGRAPGYSWRLSVAKGDREGLKRVTAAVRFSGPGGPREVVLATLAASRQLPKRTQAESSK